MIPTLAGVHHLKLPVSDFFSIGVPDRDRMEALAAHLTGLGEAGGDAP